MPDEQQHPAAPAAPGLTVNFDFYLGLDNGRGTGGTWTVETVTLSLPITDLDQVRPDHVRAAEEQLRRELEAQGNAATFMLSAGQNVGDGEGGETVPNEPAPDALPAAGLIHLLVTLPALSPAHTAMLQGGLESYLSTSANEESGALAFALSQAHVTVPGSDDLDHVRGYQVLAAPLTRQEVKDRADEDGYVKGVVAVNLNEAVGRDREEWLDRLSEHLTTHGVLHDVSYALLGHADDDVLHLLVRGDASPILEDADD